MTDQLKLPYVCVIENDRCVFTIEFVDGKFYKRVFDFVRNEEIEFEQIEKPLPYFEFNNRGVNI